MKQLKTTQIDNQKSKQSFVIMCKSFIYILFIIIISISCDRNENKPIDDMCSLFSIGGSFVYIYNCSFSDKYKIDPRIGVKSINLSSSDGTTIEIYDIFYIPEGYAKKFSFDIDDGSFVYSGSAEIFRDDPIYYIDSGHVEFLSPANEDCFY